VQYPPADHAQVVAGTPSWNATPTKPSYRLAELTVDREPAYQEIYGRYYAGMAMRSIPFSPYSSLP
jgi:hypothetical protein